MNPTETTGTESSVGGSTEKPSAEASMCAEVRFSPDMERTDKRGTPENIAARIAGRVAAKAGAPPPPNPQLFVNNGINSEAAIDYALDPDKFYNSKDPNLVILSEKPEHRIIMVLKSELKSNQEIAELTGYSPGSISQITRQPWFRKGLIKMIRVAGGDHLSALFSSAAVDSIHTMIDLRDDPNTPAATRATVCENILNRVLGKAVQKSEVQVSHVPSTDEITDLEKEIADSERDLFGNSQPS